MSVPASGTGAPAPHAVVWLVAVGGPATGTRVPVVTDDLGDVFLVKGAVYIVRWWYYYDAQGRRCGSVKRLFMGGHPYPNRPPTTTASPRPSWVGSGGNA